jgi:DNA adenine methylase
MIDAVAASASKKIRPLIKWTGGKYDEFALFSSLIPSFNNYYEPFFGGGGVFFALQPGTSCFLNDKSTDLINFYSLIHSMQFKTELLTYAEAWEKTGKLSLEIIADIATPFNNYIQEVIDATALQKKIAKIIEGLALKSHYPLFDEDFIVDQKRFIKKLQASIADKFKRIKAISNKEKRIFNSNELADHIETGIKSGLYLYLRSLTNDAAAGRLIISKEKAAANWYFVREFCYASMFRYNAKKEFNIPYGGIAYNKKNFRQKVNNIFEPHVESLFDQATFYNLDFEEFIKKTKPLKGDFIFLDPPYDSEFSEYDQNAFTKDDQLRLRDTLLKQQAQWMLVIKETDFIRELYTCSCCKIIEFDKTYTYNVRGRNNRDTKHLIIINYHATNTASLG